MLRFVFSIQFRVTNIEWCNFYPGSPASLPQPNLMQFNMYGMQLNHVSLWLHLVYICLSSNRWKHLPAADISKLSHESSSLHFYLFCEISLFCIRIKCFCFAGKINYENLSYEQISYFLESFVFNVCRFQLLDNWPSFTESKVKITSN